MPFLCYFFNIKTFQLPLSIPPKVTEKKFSPCVVGLVTEADRLYDLR